MIGKVKHYVHSFSNSKNLINRLFTNVKIN